MSARRAQGRAASSEQWCFEIMNMNDKHSYSLLMRPANFSASLSGKNFFLQNFQRKKFFKIFFKNFFLQNFQRKKFFKIFFQKFFSPEFSAEKIFQNFFSKIFFSRIFSGIFFPHHSAESKN